MNKHDQFNYPICSNLHFAPGMVVDADKSHYHIEDKALLDYLRRPGDSFRRMSILYLGRAGQRRAWTLFSLICPPSIYTCLPGMRGKSRVRYQRGRRLGHL